MIPKTIFLVTDKPMHLALSYLCYGVLKLDGLSPFRAAAPLWGKASQITRTLPPKRDCSLTRVKAHP